MKAQLEAAVYNTEPHPSYLQIANSAQSILKSCESSISNYLLRDSSFKEAMDVLVWTWTLFCAHKGTCVVGGF